MIRSMWPVATLAASLIVVIACGGAPAGSGPTTKPAQSQVTPTAQPVSTPASSAAPSAGSTDSTASLDTGLDWPTTVAVTLSSGVYDKEFADGSFTSAATARSCGSTEFLPLGFLFGFPHDIDPHDVEDVEFSAQVLRPGASTSTFAISVSIAATAAGAHPKTFLDTEDPHSGATGKARLSIIDGQRTLVADAAGEGGVTIHLTAICTPI